jgi:lipoyl-dependent peroxiredoxin
MAREPIYTAHARVTGGRVNGHGTTSDGALEVELHRPKEMGGEGNGTNPEQLFAVGYAACFESALGAVARRQKLEVEDVAIDSSVSLIPTEERGFKLGVELAVTLPSVTDSEQAIALVQAAHGVDVHLTANGAEVEHE